MKLNTSVKRVEAKVAMITGAGGGMGQGIAEVLSREGAKVVLTDRNLAAAESTAALVRAKGGEALALALDVTSEADWARAMKEALAHWGQLDVLVNNAGVPGSFPRCFEEITAQEWRSVMAVNLDGTFYGTREAVIAMREKSGSIINIGSVAGFVGTRGGAAYGSSKGAVDTLTKHAATSCARMGYRIRVNCIHPSYIWTPMVQGMASNMPGADKDDGGREALAKMHPFGVLGEPKDVAAGVLFLASDESRLMNGASLLMDGGFLAQ